MDVAVLVTDNDVLLRSLVPQLRAEGFDVRPVATAGAAQAALFGAGARIVVLDAACSGLDAPSLCRSLAEAGDVPVIVLASAPVAVDLMEFLDQGADDYLPHPDRQRELVARMRALLRRRPSGSVANGSGRLQVGDVALDRDRHEVTVAGVPVALTLKQFQLLELFLNHPGQVLPRGTILRRVWGSESPTESNTLEVQVKRLRRKIEGDTMNPTRIRTIRCIGYLYADR